MFSKARNTIAPEGVELRNVSAEFSNKENLNHVCEDGTTTRVIRGHDARLGTSERVSMRSTLRKWELVIAWTAALLVSLANYLDGVAISTFTVYAVSDFNRLSIEGSLTTVAGVATMAIQGPLALITANFEFSKLFAGAISLAALGLVLQAAAPNLACFIPGYVFYTLGIVASKFIVFLVAAELSSLRHRALAIGAINFPAVVSILAGSQISQAALLDLGWRWGFGLWCIIIPVISTMLLSFLFIYDRRVRALKGSRGNLTTKLLWHALLQQDIIGICILVAAICLFLLPLPLEQGGVEEYKQARIIVPTGIGALLFVLFPLWERYLAKNPLAPRRVMFNRNVIGALSANFFQYLTFIMSNVYFYPYLIVCSDLSISRATFITYTTPATASAVAVLYGLLVSWTKRAKWLLVLANALIVLAVGLTYAYCDPMSDRGVLVASQVIFGLGFAGLFNAYAIAQAACTHKDVPIITALFFLSSNIGSSAAGAIVGGVWTSLLPQNLRAVLPEELKGQAQSIMNSVTVATSFELGSPTRGLIIDAYRTTFKSILLGCLVLSVIGFLCTFVVGNVTLEDNNGGETE